MDVMMKAIPADMMTEAAKTRTLIERTGYGDDLTEADLIDLYCGVPDVLRERDAFERGLRAVVEAADKGAGTEDLRRVALRFLPSVSHGAQEGNDR